MVNCVPYVDRYNILLYFLNVFYNYQFPVLEKEKFQCLYENIMKKKLRNLFCTKILNRFASQFFFTIIFHAKNDDVHKLTVNIFTNTILNLRWIILSKAQTFENANNKREVIKITCYDDNTKKCIKILIIIYINKKVYFTQSIK